MSSSAGGGTRYARWAAKWRVPLHFLLAGVLVVFARPTPERLFTAAALVAVGLAVRAWAAGHLWREASLVTSGPYAYVRHPLYVGSAFVLAGFALASGRWWLAGLLAAYFFLFFLPVMQREERERQARAEEAYTDYAARVPALFPCRKAYRSAGNDTARFRARLYLANREWRAGAGCVLLLLLLAAKWLWA